jgi:hypothetical protein
MCKQRWFFAAVALAMWEAQIAVAEQIAWVDWRIPLASGVALGGWPDGVQVDVTAIAASGTVNPIEFEQLGFAQFVGTFPFGDTRVPFTNYWTEGTPKPYTGNTLVSNAPTPYELVALDKPGTITVTFSKPVIKPLMAILSLGTSTIPVTYSFDKPFTILSGGQGFWGRGTAIQVNNTLTGREFHGLIQFEGTVSSISWTSSPEENWHAFTLGLACYVPDGETTTFARWSQTFPTAATWNATLGSLPGMDFEGRTVRETDAGSGSDSCWYPGSIFPSLTDIPPAEATVGAGDLYIDTVGWTPAPVIYYQANGRLPCEFVSRQQVQMKCPDGSFRSFGDVRVLKGGIRSTSVTSYRDGHTASRRWP